LQRLQHVTKPGSLVVLISDFYQLDAACNPHLNRLSLKNQLLAFQVCDPIEQTAPTPGLYPITNGQQSGWLDVRSKSARAAYQNQCDANICRIEEQFNALHTPCTVVTPLTDLPPLVHRVFPRKRHG
jgi:hypothetical protein